MFELEGKYGSAKVFTDVVDQESISQVITLLNQPYAEGQRIRMMPDIHAGAGCTIGTTMTIGDKICPNMVGVDIGCGMLVAKISNKNIDLAVLDALIREQIPSGFEVHDEYCDSHVDLSGLYCADSVNLDRAYRSVGTLGGGNHFIEANKDDEGNIYIVIHSGSRHLGVDIATHYQERAFNELGKVSPEETKHLIDSLKAQGRQNEIQTALKCLKGSITTMPKQLAYVEGTTLNMYLHDMAIAQNYAVENRLAMMNKIISGMGLDVVEMFATIHNYIDMDNLILRKGAVSAQKGEKLIIPINMRDGSLICTGKGNVDWNFSAPHGAGRLMSRSAAKERFTVEEFEKQMEGIFTTSVNRSTLDECPMAYKRIEDIVDNIEPTVEIHHIITPIYNFKAGEKV